MAYSFTSRVRYSEIGRDRRLKLTSLIDYFQDCATFHSDSVGQTMEYLYGNDVAWILAGWQIVIDRYPDFGETIELATWPYLFRSLYGYRNLVMRTEEGEILARANSLWFIYNLRTGHPVRDISGFSAPYQVEPKLEMNYAPRKIPVSGEGEDLEPVPVMKHQIDTNGHVNNSQYILMARDCIPEDFPVGQLRAEYRNQAVPGDIVMPKRFHQTDESKERYVIRLDGGENRTFCTVEFQQGTTK